MSLSILFLQFPFWKVFEANVWILMYPLFKRVCVSVLSNYHSEITATLIFFYKIESPYSYSEFENHKYVLNFFFPWSHHVKATLIFQMTCMTRTTMCIYFKFHLKHQYTNRVNKLVYWVWSHRLLKGWKDMDIQGALLKATCRSRNTFFRKWDAHYQGNVLFQRKLSELIDALRMSHRL